MSTLPPLNSHPKTLKEERLRRKLAKMFGLPRHASIATVIAAVAKAKGWVDGRAAAGTQQHQLSVNATAQAGLAGRGEHTLEELLRLVTDAKAIPAGLAAIREPAIVALSEPLEALRDRS